MGKDRPPVRDKRLLRSNIEFYAGFGLAIVLVVFPMTWWLKVILIITLGAILVDLIIRSPLTIKRHWFQKVVLSSVALILLGIISWNPVKEQWLKDHPIKQLIEQKTPNIATPLPQSIPMGKIKKEAKVQPITPRAAPPTPTRREQAKKDGGDTFNIAPGGIGTKNQMGDNYIFPKEEIPEPKFDFKPISSNIIQLKTNLFKTEILLTIQSRVALNNLYLEVKAPSITLLRVTAQRTGAFITGNSFTGEIPEQKLKGKAYTNLQNAYGKYILEITSTKPEKFEIIYDYK